MLSTEEIKKLKEAFIEYRRSLLNILQENQEQLSQLNILIDERAIDILKQFETIVETKEELQGFIDGFNEYRKKQKNVKLGKIENL